jgi:hypothetical protein
MNIVTFPNAFATTPETTAPEAQSFPQLDALNWQAKFGQYAMLTTPENTPTLIKPWQKRPIFRDDTQEWLGDCGAGYAIAQNSDLRDVLQEACESALPKEYLAEIKLDEKQSHGGAFTSFSVRFADSGKEIRQLVKNTGYSKLWNGGENTLLNLGFGVTNSFGGKSPVIIRSLVTDLACDNGMVLDILGGKSSRRHTSGYTPEYFIPFIKEQVKKYESKIEVWNAWAQAKITPAQAQETLEGMGIASRLTAKFMEQLDIEAQSRGFTVWGLHSCLTHFSSHDSELFPVHARGEQKDNVAQTLDRRQNQVSDWLASPAWASLTGIAA